MPTRLNEWLMAVKTETAPENHDDSSGLTERIHGLDDSLT